MDRWICLGVVAAAVFALAAQAAGNPLNANITVQVHHISSSGACGVDRTRSGVGVVCGVQAPGGPLSPMAGALPLQRVSVLDLLPGVAEEPLTVYSDGVKITSWRIVTLDNARYVELTIAW